MTALSSIPRYVGHWAISWVRATGALALLLARTLYLLPRMDRREYLRAMADYGYGTLPLALIVSVVSGAMVVMQTSLYTERFGARSFLGWAAGYAVLWEFGPLLLGLTLAARVGSRNAAELASLNVGGQIEGLTGISLDPLAILVAPRVWAVLTVVTLLAMPSFAVTIVCEVIAAKLSLDLPPRVFLSSFEQMLGLGELAGGVIKSFAYAWAIALVSTAAGLSAKGGSRAVGAAAASAVVYGAASIFSLDFVLSLLLARAAGVGGA